MKTKKVIESLDKIIDLAGSLSSSHGELDHYDQKLSGTKNRKKGYQVRFQSFRDNSAKLEYVHNYLMGDVESFFLKVTLGYAHMDDAQARIHMDEHTTIEGWMTMRDKNVLYGEYNMENIAAAVDFKDGDKPQNRFAKELGKNIVNAVDEYWEILKR
ncbi:MAG: hypothetical protein KKA79_09055 [Nanoarchaeota archaeon]|nr:hypothetical protein [Nanoarchaeota archaeon]MCG2717934.1 hypothetical protein [Nanoarchaeota archaeon]